MTVPSPRAFDADLAMALRVVREASIRLEELYAELHDALYAAPITGGAGKISGSSGQLTPVESIVLMRTEQRRALERTARKVRGTGMWWNSLVRDLELAFAAVEQGSRTDESPWSEADRHAAEDAARKRQSPRIRWCPRCNATTTTRCHHANGHA